AEDLFGERGGGGRDRSRALSDCGLCAHLATCVQRVPEDTVEQCAGRARLVRRPHLAQDLPLAGHERVEPRGDTEEMERGGVVAQPVEHGLELAEDLDRAAFRLVRVLCLDIELGAVACGETDRGAELLRNRVRLVPVERNALAQLDGSVVVRGADEDQVHQPKCVAGRASRTRMTSAKPASARYAARLPDQPTARTAR